VGFWGNGVAKTSLIETRSIDYVPLAERHGKAWHMWPIWFMGDAHLATLAAGAMSVAMGLNLMWTAVAIVTGCAFGTFFMAFHSTQGPQLGLPQMIQSRPQFGYLGAMLVWVVALVTYVGYNSLNQLLAGATLHHLAGIPRGVGILGFTTLGLGLALVGYDWIHRAQRWLSGLLIIALLAFSLGAAIRLPIAAGHLSPAEFKAIPFLIQFFGAAAYQLSWSIYVSDYSRYLPRDVGVKVSFWWTFMGAMIGGVWMMLVGALAATLAPKVDIIQAVRQAGDGIFPGFGVVVLVVGMLGLVSATALNFYGASLTLISIADSAGIKPSKPGRVVSLLLMGVVATAIAFLSPQNIMGQFENLLSVLIYLFTPWTAINLVDFYFVRKTHYSVREIFNPRGMYGLWNWRGLGAYAIGFAAMIPFFSTGLYTGPVAQALGGADISMLIGLPVSALAYLLACRSLDTQAEAARALAADVGLESG